jgi:uncharacterized protein YbaP (TraB family)
MADRHTMPNPMRKAKMIRLFSALAGAVCFTLFLTPAAQAACNGTDLRPDMTAAQIDYLNQLKEGRAYPTGNHWLAEKEGEALHLIGTLHIDAPGIGTATERLRPVVESASTVLLEMTAREKADVQAHLASNPALLVLQDTSLPDVMGEEAWTTLSAALRARGIPPFMAAKFQPWYLSTLLGIPSCFDLQGLAASKGVDARIEAMADQAGIPTGALEPFDAAIGLFADMPLAQQIDMLQVAMTPEELQEDLFATLLAAYLSEDHVESWLVGLPLTEHIGDMGRAEAEALFADFENRLLVKRNQDWIPVLEQTLADTDGPVVAAFGAAHLGGEFGVLNLLAEQGYTLTRQPF